ncbi:hypothetical protein [Oscillibacter sp.]|uniref:hypothetical protein n=1 Tax=Oscillibacter sp. TaxID=1945593 RepID=UPI0028994F6B|nr:hypothetical protein [Oscillibacter sp.]
MGGKTSNESKAKYNAKAYDRLYPFVPKGRKAEIQAAADAVGESLNDFIRKAIDERMERMEGVGGAIKHPTKGETKE